MPRPSNTKRTMIINWLVQHPELLDQFDETSRESRDRLIHAMKEAGVLRRETANHFIRIDQYAAAARAEL